MKVIVSFSTIPSRIEFIEPIIQSLYEQSVLPDEIHLQIPEFSKKEQVEYQIPLFLSNYSRVKVQFQKYDFGSATKWIYPIEYLKDEEETILIIVDDDCLHDQNCIKDLLVKMENSSNSSFCFSGGVFSREPEKVSRFMVSDKVQPNSLTILENIDRDTQVDTVQGFGMFALRPSWFQKIDLSLIKTADIFDLSDDIVISGLLCCLGIERVQVYPFRSPRVLSHADINPIHGDGRLIRLTLNAVLFFNKEFNIWKDVVCVYPTKESYLRRVINKMKFLAKRLI